MLIRLCGEFLVWLMILATLGCGGVQDPAATNVSPPAGATQPAITASEPRPRDPIYIEEANGEQLLAAALQRARAGGKHVLIEWGGNWCSWCYKLHDVFHGDATVRPILEESFELLLIDSTKNRDLMQSYGGKDRQFSFPHLTVLDADGQVLTNQNTEPLEEGREHDPQKVAAFLKDWAPKR